MTKSRPHTVGEVRPVYSAARTPHPTFGAYGYRHTHKAPAYHRHLVSYLEWTHSRASSLPQALVSYLSTSMHSRGSSVLPEYVHALTRVSYLSTSSEWSVTSGQLSSSKTWRLQSDMAEPLRRCLIPLSVILSQWERTYEGREGVVRVGGVNPSRLPYLLQPHCSIVRQQSLHSSLPLCHITNPCTIVGGGGRGGLILHACFATIHVSHWYSTSAKPSLFGATMPHH